MALTLDFSDDFRVYANPETVRMESVHAGAGPAVDSLTAKRRWLTRREIAASNGAYTGADINWWFPKKQLDQGSQIEPKPGDLIIPDDGVQWTVLEVALGKFRATWKCVCRNMIIAYDLRDTVTIERAIVGEDSTSAAKRDWTPLYPNLVCRVQPQVLAVADSGGRRGQESQFIIYASRQLPRLNVRECRGLVVTARTNPELNGRYLDLDRYENPERIADLPQIPARLKV